jgi:hypothetical protein
MIEAVIWDWVLTTSPFEAFSRIETEQSLPVDIIDRESHPLPAAWTISIWDDKLLTAAPTLGGCQSELRFAQPCSLS